ncbi:MAG TPA: phosphatase PAP2 family protein [Phenylobacterium sp.]
MMGPKTAAGAAALALLMAGGPAAASDHSWQTVADVGVISLTAASLGTTAWERDWTGAKQLGLDVGATAATTWGLKHAFPEERPNHDNRRSFPSGHTAVSFAEAGYLQQRYGWQVGLPATAMAALVGYARVRSHDHHWYDVVAGAAVGEGYALVFTRPHDQNVRVVPWADSHGAGFALAARF